MNEWDSFQKKHGFLICIDSDGCAFDVMDLKHQECFCPAAIEHFSLQPVSRYARNAWDFVNLYSSTRGIHRLLALERVLDLMEKRREVVERGFQVPRLPSLREYIAKGLPLSNDGMRQYLSLHPKMEDLAQTIRWSDDVNARVAHMVHGVPPFPNVRESLTLAAKEADIAIVSATQSAALQREWNEHGLMSFVSIVCGQEMGTKKACIEALQKRYDAEHVLMLGDAPGDMTAAHTANALFYPICPGAEVESWRAFPEYAAKFFSSAYRADEAALIARFLALLPQTPPWDEV